MRIVLLIILLAAVVTLPVNAQFTGAIGVYGDYPGLSECFLTETLYVRNYVYVVHNLGTEASGSRFRIENNWSGPIVGPVNYHGNAHVGDIYTGVSFDYLGCKSLPHLLATLEFIPISPSPSCLNALFVTPDPSVPDIEVVDCAGVVKWGFSSSSITVNSDGYCCNCCPATESTTWSRLKALYN